MIPLSSCARWDRVFIKHCTFIEMLDLLSCICMYRMYGRMDARARVAFARLPVHLRCHMHAYRYIYIYICLYACIGLCVNMENCFIADSFFIMLLALCASLILSLLFSIFALHWPLIQTNEAFSCSNTRINIIHLHTTYRIYIYKFRWEWITNNWI